MSLQITITRSRTAYFSIAVTNEDGSAFDLSGTTLVVTARSRLAGPVVFEKDSDGHGIVIANQTTNKGQATMEITPSDTSSLSANAQLNELFYDLVLNAGSQVWPLVSGKIVVEANVT